MRPLALVLAILAGASRATAGAPDGARIYAERCSGCHGDDGRGDGPAAAAIIPPPKNFRDAAFWKGRTVEQLRTIVTKGKPSTMMAPFEGVLTSAEIDAVVEYVRHFDPSAGVPAAAPK
ncbi:MAG TPA: c-type cytochrome [Candidatus Eisenbacteria bacterium]|nr:c-type cytochrome [Candidatus Eisenbacteria bacterium]